MLALLLLLMMMMTLLHIQLLLLLLLLPLLLPLLLEARRLSSSAIRSEARQVSGRAILNELVYHAAKGLSHHNPKVVEAAVRLLPKR